VLSPGKRGHTLAQKLGISCGKMHRMCKQIGGYEKTKLKNWDGSKTEKIPKSSKSDLPTKTCKEPAIF